MSPEEYCQQKAAQSGSSFYYSSCFCRRNAEGITALYAFCREVDDAVDECSDDAIAHTKLSWWRKEINAMLQGNPHRIR